MKKITTLALASACIVATSHATQFTLTVQNYGPQPLSPLFFSASDVSFNIFSVGQGASLGIKNIAETGNAAAELAIAAGAGPAVAAFGKVGNTPLGPGGTGSTTFSTDSNHGFFSFAAMLGKTNDGFIGESVATSGYDLFNGTTPQNLTIEVFGDRAWDAGTEKNTQNKADLSFLGGTGNPAEDPSLAFVHRHAGVQVGVGDSWQLLPQWQQSTHLATITVAAQAVPEPATMAILGLGGALVARRRKR